MIDMPFSSNSSVFPFDERPETKLDGMTVTGIRSRPLPIRTNADIPAPAIIRRRDVMFMNFS